MERTGTDEAYFKGLKELSALYLDVKSAIIMAEELDIEHKLNIAPLNQLRNALDHIFNGLIRDDEEKGIYELKEAKEHIQRAGYDALQILIVQLGKQIVEIVRKYETETVSAVFPKYYQEIRPLLAEHQQDVALLRTRMSIEGNKTFSAYFVEVKKMHSLWKVVFATIPLLEEYQQKRDKERRKRSVLQIISGVGIAVIAGLIVWYITTKCL